MPDMLALCFFSGLPIILSSGFFGAARSYEALVRSVGVGAALLVVCGGVEPAVGVFEAGDFRVADDPASKSSAECCRFSLEVCQY